MAGLIAAMETCRGFCMALAPDEPSAWQPILYRGNPMSLPGLSCVLPSLAVLEASKQHLLCPS